MSVWKVSSWPTLFSTRSVSTRACIEAAREVPDAVAHRRSESAIEDGARRLEDVGDRVDAAGLERLARLGADPPQRADRSGGEEGRSVGLGDDQQPVRLADRRGDLGDVLRGGDADAAGQPRLLEDPPPQEDRDLPGAPPQPTRAAHVEEGLVDRERLDDGRELMEDLHDRVDSSIYRSKCGATTIAVGHSRSAWPMGIAERTPKRRASYVALETTPRPSVPPTMTGLPRSDGSSSTSTAAKNASMSTCRMPVPGVVRTLR